jgi:hypothetical protein
MAVQWVGRAGGHPWKRSEQKAGQEASSCSPCRATDSIHDFRPRFGHRDAQGLERELEWLLIQLDRLPRFAHHLDPLRTCVRVWQCRSSTRQRPPLRNTNLKLELYALHEDVRSSSIDRREASWSATCFSPEPRGGSVGSVAWPPHPRPVRVAPARDTARCYRSKR